MITGSIMALVGSAFHNPAYTASKGGLHAFARALAVQYAPLGIRVNVVAPGAMEEPPDGEEIDLAAREKRLIPKIPMGRVGRFDELAPVVAFLASDEASYCTGAWSSWTAGFTGRGLLKKVDAGELPKKTADAHVRPRWPRASRDAALLKTWERGGLD